jgi:hypothetical protein
MYLEGSKIKQLISHYGESKGYPEKSHVAKFCEDFNLNYTQWNAYTRDAQNIGIKIIDKLMEIFPNLNLNWLFKDAYNMWIEDEKLAVVSEDDPKYSREVVDGLYKNVKVLTNKLAEIHRLSSIN